MKRAILVVSYGTLYEAAWQQTIGAIEQEVQASSEGWDVLGAYTGRRVIQQWRERGKILMNEEEALQYLKEQGYQQVAIVPTHLVRGQEYGKLERQAGRWQLEFKKLQLGTPLLGTVAKRQKVAEVILEELSVAMDEALVLMGHGADTEANEVYQELGQQMQLMGQRTLVSTMEADWSEVLRRVAAMDVKKIILAPLLLTAGNHAVRDMAGDGEDSWKRRLEAAGYSVRCVIKGLGEYSAVRKIYAAEVSCFI